MEPLVTIRFEHTPDSTTKSTPLSQFLEEADLRHETRGLRIVFTFFREQVVLLVVRGDRKGGIRQDGGRNRGRFFLVFRNSIIGITICYDKSLVSYLIFSEFLVQKNLTTYSLCGLFSPSDKPNLILPFARLRTGIFFVHLPPKEYYLSTVRDRFGDVISA